MNNKCSLCIPTYKRPDMLNRLLSAIAAMNDDRIAEVIIAVSYAAEDSVNEETKHILRMFEICGIRYRLVYNVQGLMAAKKLFKKMAREEILLMIDDDAVITRDYLNLLDNFNDPKVAAVSGSLQTPVDISFYKEWAYDAIDNPDVSLCNRIRFKENGLLYIADKYQVYMLKNPQKYECECLVGTAMYIRRDLFEPDENYNRGSCNYEEYDYTYSLYRKGYKLIFDSSEIAFHFHSNVGGMRETDIHPREVNSKYFREKFGL